METAKVDIRKLQTLNDCINRTIEALNQVRLSVHGGSLPYSPLGAQSLGAPSYLGAYSGAYGSPFGIAPSIVGQLSGVVPGIAHSAAAAALGATPWAGLAPSAAYGPAAYGPAAYGAAAYGPAAYGAAAYGPLAYLAQQGLGAAQAGLGHSGAADARLGYEYADPYASARIAQTFPFVHWGYSPFGWPSV
jgi:hypothetical protein